MTSSSQGPNPQATYGVYTHFEAYIPRRGLAHCPLAANTAHPHVQFLTSTVAIYGHSSGQCPCMPHCLAHAQARLPIRADCVLKERSGQTDGGHAGARGGECIQCMHCAARFRAEYHRSISEHASEHSHTHAHMEHLSAPRGKPRSSHRCVE